MRKKKKKELSDALNIIPIVLTNIIWCPSLTKWPETKPCPLNDGTLVLREVRSFKNLEEMVIRN